MNIWFTYAIIAVILAAVELVYFRFAQRCNIFDKPNERSSHTSVILRGGGVIFTISMIVWLVLMSVQGMSVVEYLPFMCGLILVSIVSFCDDVNPLPDSLRLVVQFVAVMFMFWSIELSPGIQFTVAWYWVFAIGMVALIVFVGATNVINFMDGINGITAGYSLAVLLPLLIVDGMQEFIEPSYIVVVIIGVLVFSYFNFRPKGKAKCFAGDVGSISIAFILLFAIGRLIMKTGDASWLIFLMVYGVDGCSTILHRIKLHENLGEAHRKHAFQLMANELGMSHITVSLIYMVLQLAISLVMIYLVPNTPLAHWLYLLLVLISLELAYLLFMKKYYHLHEEYLKEVSRL